VALTTAWVKPCSAWTCDGLLFGYVNRAGQGNSILVVTKMLMWSARSCPKLVSADNKASYLEDCTRKAMKDLARHMKPLVAVQGKLGDRRIFNGATPTLEQTRAEHLPWGDTVVCIEVGFQGRGVVDASGKRRIGRVVSDGPPTQHAQLNALMSSAVLDHSVLLDLLQDVANAAHFIEPKLKPVDRQAVEALVAEAMAALDGTAAGRDQKIRQQTLEECLAALRHQDDAIEAAEDLHDEEAEEEYLETEDLEDGGRDKQPHEHDESDEEGQGNEEGQGKHKRPRAL
jgi:hypothetical protein